MATICPRKSRSHARKVVAVVGRVHGCSKCLVKWRIRTGFLDPLGEGKIEFFVEFPIEHFG